jgi:predicted PurR-regulated permease PerM
MTTTSEIRQQREDFSADTPDSDADGPKEARDRSLLRRLAIGLVSLAAGLYVLEALGDLLRPVMIAVLICYAIWPIHAWLSRYSRPGLSLLIIGVGFGIVCFAIGWMAFANAERFWEDLP